MRTVGAVVLCAVLVSGATVCAAAPAKPKLPRCPTVGAAVGGADAFPKAVKVSNAVTGVVVMGEACLATCVDARVAGVGAVQGSSAAGFGGDVGAVDRLKGEPSTGLGGDGNQAYGAASPASILLFGSAVAGGGNEAYGGLGALLAGGQDAPAAGALAGSAGPSLVAPACTGLVPLARMPVSGLVLAGMSPARKTRWDLKEGLPEVTRWCVLGELGARADRETDDAAYQRLTGECWKTLEAAMERRRVLGRGERAKSAAGE